MYLKSKMVVAHYYANEMTFDLDIVIFWKVFSQVLITLLGIKIGFKMYLFCSLFHNWKQRIQ